MKSIKSQLKDIPDIMIITVSVKYHDSKTQHSVYYNVQFIPIDYYVQSDNYSQTYAYPL